MLQHLGRTSKSVTRFSNGNVEDDLLDAKLLHGIGALSFGHFCCWSSVVGVKIVVDRNLKVRAVGLFENMSVR